MLGNEKPGLHHCTIKFPYAIILSFKVLYISYMDI